MPAAVAQDAGRPPLNCRHGEPRWARLLGGGELGRARSCDPWRPGIPGAAPGLGVTRAVRVNLIEFHRATGIRSLRQGGFPERALTRQQFMLIRGISRRFVPEPPAFIFRLAFWRE